MTTDGQLALLGQRHPHPVSLPFFSKIALISCAAWFSALPETQFADQC